MTSIAPDRRTIEWLHQFLLHRGWVLDNDTTDLCWFYPLAFRGRDIQLDPAQLEHSDLAEFGPLRPSLYLTRRSVVVFAHGTWNGCVAHRERRDTVRIADVDFVAKLGRRVAVVEQASVSENPVPFHRCLRFGPCGDWFRTWQQQGGPWKSAGPTAERPP